MIDGIHARSLKSASAPATPLSAKDQRDATLMKSASQLEGMFVQQLYKAMRETVPQQEGIVSGGAGEDIFTGLLDQHLAAETPKQWEHGIAQALYRQLRHGIVADAPQASVTTPGSNTR
ncbi:rod-binding protein [Gemmatimonas sp.]|jgi:flagellar protein FlgJ|uniref:rod-binding protein n=1 Tax=Gemmatimonas sp. TaxID=1962908 RepID=UPI0037BF4C6C